MAPIKLFLVFLFVAITYAGLVKLFNFSSVLL